MRTPFCWEHRWTMVRNEMRAWFRCPRGGEVITDEVRETGPTIKVTLEIEDRFTPAVRRAQAATFKVFAPGEIANPAAPTVAEIAGGVDLSCFVTNAPSTWAAPPSGEEMLDSVLRAREIYREAEYQERLEAERFKARMALRGLLDDWCWSFGWEPWKVWREHTMLDDLRERWREQDRVDSMALALRYAARFRVQDPSSVFKITDAGL